ncbi:ribonuclease H-like domain-containing protein [Xylariomycetidae sp. FL0641]|nr:ribonuclease H-like domain-containing protein [Xylariomycetidae sp. FL0641]
MVYRMVFYVDGACRGNGQFGACGAAAACLKARYGTGFCPRSMLLPMTPPPTNQRAEMLAIIIALEWALDKCNELHSDPFVEVKIHSDSRYAIGCMTDWIGTWKRNDWVNARGVEVANIDLVQGADILRNQLEGRGRVDFVWVPREENSIADKQANDALDSQIAGPGIVYG